MNTINICHIIHLKLLLFNLWTQCTRCHEDASTDGKPYAERKPQITDQIQKTDTNIWCQHIGGKNTAFNTSLISLQSGTMYAELKQISICDLMRNQTFSLHAQVKCYQQYFVQLGNYTSISPKKLLRQKQYTTLSFQLTNTSLFFFFKSRNTSIKT